jgi:nucleoside-diphosphate-sugar epimerase
MKLFITGGTGFIGSNFINYASALDVDIVAQKRLGSFARMPLRNPEKVSWVNKGLDEDFTENLRDCDALIHFAAHSVLPPLKPLSECLYWNVYSALKLLEAADRAGVKNVIIAGSCSEYGLTANDYEKIPPSAPLKPAEAYGLSKAQASEACINFAKGKGLKLQVLRIFQAYGDGENESRFWPSLKKAALNGYDFPMSSGEQIRDFIHVSKVCDEFLNALSDKTVKYGEPTVRNIAEGEGKSVIDFASLWWDKFQAKGQLMPGLVKLRPGEIGRIVADINVVDRR